LIILKSPSEIEGLRKANQIGAEILQKLREMVKPGVTTADLEAVVEAEVKRRGVRAAFKGVQNPQGVPFKWNICASVNDEIVHGIPSRKKVLNSGDLLSVDFGVCCEGFYGDSAFSVAVGDAPQKVHRLIKTVEDALYAGIDQARPGNRLGDLGEAVQTLVEGAGYTVVREFVGHGIGRELHEAPQVPNYGKRGTGVKMRAGMVIAIEPMIIDGPGGVQIDDDGWTARTLNASLAAHAEHSVAITEDGPVILSKL
jgi:methionyl aminopeptidase